MHLILNDITYGESLAPFNTDFESYKKSVFLFLNHKGRYLFADDILHPYNKNMTLEQLFEQEQGRFVPGAFHLKNSKPEKTWYDLWGMEEIEPQDHFFDFFFACKLRHLSLLEISGFLSFQLEYNFKGNSPKFFTFLKLTLKQQEKLLNPGILEAVQEWVQIKQVIPDKKEALSGTEKDEIIKGRMPREAGDQLTTLNLNQTALLIQLMQQTGIILKGDYLTYLQAGKAFHILTGFSQNSIRQQLGTKGEIAGVKHEDYKELHQALVKMANLIAPKIHTKP